MTTTMMATPTVSTYCVTSTVHRMHGVVLFLPQSYEILLNLRLTEVLDVLPTATQEVKTNFEGHALGHKDELT